eukprot:Clim_evm14s147 gene=Clim_evmTU14s147
MSGADLRSRRGVTRIGRSSSVRLWHHEASQFKGYEFVINGEMMPNAFTDCFARISLVKSRTGSKYLVLKALVADSKTLKGSSFQVSMERNLAEQFGFGMRSDVNVVIVDEASYSVHLVSVSFRDQYIGRGDMWRFKRELRSSALYVGKTIVINGIHASVRELWKDNTSIHTGILTEETNVVYRSGTARVFVMVQMSSELQDYAYDGDTYLEKVLDCALKELVTKWLDAGVNHHVSFILTGRIHYTKDEANEMIDDRTALRATKFLKGGALAEMFYEDIYHMACELESSTLNVVEFIASMRTSINGFYKKAHRRSADGKRLGRLCAARSSNFLEAINLGLNVFERHRLDRNLDRTGQLYICISANSGVFEVQPQLARMTKRRMIDHGIVCDFISVAMPPLHAIPLFIHLDEPVSHSDGSGKGAPTYSSPDWIYMIFYRDWLINRQCFIPVGSSRLDLLIPDGSSNGLGMEPYRFISMAEDKRCQHCPENPGGEDEENVVADHLGWSQMESYDRSVFSSSRRSHALREKLASVNQARMRRERHFSQGASLSPLRSTRLLDRLPAIRKAMDEDHLSEMSDESPSIVGGEGSGHSVTATEEETSIMGIPIDIPMSHASRSSFGGDRLGLSHKSDTLAGRIHSHSISSSSMMDLGLAAAMDHNAKQAQQTDRFNPFQIGANRQKMTANRRRWAHLTPNVKWVFGYEHTGPNWDALCEPACLPITTDYFPDAGDLHGKFNEHNYTLYPAVLDSISKEKSKVAITDLAMRALVSQRLAQGFQLIMSTGSSQFSQREYPLASGGGRRKSGIESSERFRLSFGRIYHIISRDGELIDVKRYSRGSASDTVMTGPVSQRARSLHMDPISQDYTYSLIGSASHNTLRKAKFIHEPHMDHQWNYIDQLIIGNLSMPVDESSGGIKIWRSRFAKMQVSDEKQSTLTTISDFEEVLNNYVKFSEKFQSYGSPKSGLADVPSEVNLKIMIAQDCFIKLPLKKPTTPEAAKNMTRNQQSKLSMETECHHLVYTMMSDSTGILPIFTYDHDKDAKPYFFGFSLINWILQSFEDVPKRKDAILFATELLNKQVIEHTGPEKTFSDDCKIFTLAVSPLNAIWKRDLRRPLPVASLSVPITSKPILDKWAMISLHGLDAKGMDAEGMVDDGSPWFILWYDSVFAVNTAFHFEFHWLTTMASTVDDLVQGLQRRAHQLGFPIMPIPSTPVVDYNAESPTMNDSSPFRTMRKWSPAWTSGLAYAPPLDLNATEYAPPARVLTMEEKVQVLTRILADDGNFLLDFDNRNDCIGKVIAGIPQTSPLIAVPIVPPCMRFLHRTGAILANLHVSGDDLDVNYYLNSLRTARWISSGVVAVSTIEAQIQEVMTDHALFRRAMVAVCGPDIFPLPAELVEEPIEEGATTLAPVVDNEKSETTESLQGADASQAPSRADVESMSFAPGQENASHRGSFVYSGVRYHPEYTTLQWWYLSQQ